MFGAPDPRALPPEISWRPDPQGRPELEVGIRVPQVYSHSRLGCFEKCPRQFRYRYVDGIPAPFQSIEAFLGKRVHEVIERLHRFVARGRIPGLPAVLRRFGTLWEESFDRASVRIARSGMQADDYLALGERCLSNFYRGHYPFDAEETVGVEEPVGFVLDGETRIRGIVDRIVRTRHGHLEVHDYKTGRRLPTQKQLDADRQLAFYEIGVRERFGQPAGEVRLVWHFLQYGATRRSTRSTEQLESLREETSELIDRIRGETTFEPRPSPLCGWCEYRDLCPAAPGQRASDPRFSLPSPATAPTTPPAIGQLSLL